MATRTRSKPQVKPKKDDDLESMKRTTARGGCPRCKKRDTVGFLKIDILKYGGGKSASGAKHIKSKSRSMCATCIKEVFVHLTVEFEKEVDE